MPQSLRLLPLIGLGLLSSGCFLGDRAADRTLEIYQIQDMRTYDGAFQIDATRLPSDAIESRVDRGSAGAPVTSLVIKQGYPVKIMLVPATQPSAGGQAE